MNLVMRFVMCVASVGLVNTLSSEETTEVTETCCSYVDTIAVSSPSVAACQSKELPDYIQLEPGQEETCRAAMSSCCQEQFKQKDDCAAGMKFVTSKRCSDPSSDFGKICCEECSFGQISGRSQGINSCGAPPDGEGIGLSSFLRREAYYKCCLDAVNNPETTTEKKIPTTTAAPAKAKETCKSDSCSHNCDDSDGVVRCTCREGFRLQADKKTCNDINECLEAQDDLCIADDTVCHNIPGAFKCVPIKKRDIGITCPPGFKRNVQNQVCDDINECQLPGPPCPKYLCENTVGGFKCNGKPGKPFEELIPGNNPAGPRATDPPPDPENPKNDICPQGFRAGANDECNDIDECKENSDDCQRLSQHCINTHGSFFCQDHVSKRCAPGFKVNTGTGICEDIDECEESSEVCRRTEVCVNLPGAYNCKSKISQLPKLATKNCQEGTRLKPGGKSCEDIDECREGTHLCDRFQNCINTFGAHECRCKKGFELDSSSGSCVDIDECALKLDNCNPGQRCQNVLGSFTCTRQTSTSTTTQFPVYEYEYYDSDEENTTETEPTNEVIPTTSKPTTPKPTTTSTTTPRPTYPPRTTTKPTRRPYSPYQPDRPTTPENRKPDPRPITPDNRRPNRPTTPEDRTLDPQPTTPDDRRPDRPTTSENRNPRPTTDGRKPESTPPMPALPDHPESTPTRPGDRTTPDRRPVYNPYGPSRPEDPIDNNPSQPEYPSRPNYPRRPGSPGRQPGRRPPYLKPTTTTEIPTTTIVASGFDPNEVHCLYGFEKDENGNCADVNECEKGQHICSSLENCVNRAGGYTCECISGFRRADDGWCVVITTSPASTTTSTTTTTTSTTSSTTERPSPNAVDSSPEWPYQPYPTRPPPRVTHPGICELGYTFDRAQARCVDIDECTEKKDTCSNTEKCVNMDGGFRCVCSSGCPDENEKPSYVPVQPPQPARQPSGSDSNVITVGSQYGQRGPWSPRPTHTYASGGNLMVSCPWGYRLTPEKRCYDVDECARNISSCGPQQRCENFNGGYSCQCPAGHKLVGQNGCEDIDECTHGNPCSYYSQCINSVGSYRCQCSDGLRNAPSNDKVCEDVNECTETPGVCQHSCANSWGGYRCFCERGYRLASDNRTCTDINECEEWSSMRGSRAQLCGGQCINIPGSYKCGCPSGYRLSEDERSCIDIDECESGEATCARTSDPGQVCQNTRGSYHCHQIECPQGYKLESKHRCSRIQRSCAITDWACLQQPGSYSYNFVTFVSNIYLSSGSVDLFTMHGPSWSDSVLNFEMKLVRVQASPGVTPANPRCFDMRPSGNMCVISLLCSLEGPQVAELELSMSLYQHRMFAGSTVARLVVIVSAYEF